ncbi:hypothetical protein [Paenibacillus sp. MMS20-IR301]|uniref:hypothetical protein n=1 Tax=Paenibacillus sp. MMS20-IR301 TaxID=2895946 RepID=UPI0028E3D73A|nr:hypothetical protein [Paenibacillus sp. MMS20-IR301]WNS41747.1 hypothetical protein LOS79_22385 [Paenibacillus sp. MMS20-IR301]
MGELLELRLEVLPGIIKAAGSLGSAAGGRAGQPGSKRTGAEEQLKRVSLTLNIPVWSAERKREVIGRLSGHPGELYDVLQGSLNGGPAQLELLPTDSELQQAVSGQETGALPAEELLARVKRQLADEPLLAFALRGLPKEELLSGVFALWAGQGNERSGETGGTSPAPGTLASELARLERKGPAVSSSEWLAEAAAEGSLHQPGPLFHEISARPFPAIPDVIEPQEEWGLLLQQTPKAPAGLALLLRRVSEAAAGRAAGLNKL